MHDITLDKIRALIGLLTYGGVFDSLHEQLESLYKMRWLKKINFSAVMGKNRFRFLLSMIRFDAKATRAKRCLNDKLVTFCKIWDMFFETCNLMCLFGGLICIIPNSYCLSEKDVPFGSTCLKIQESTESKFG